MRKPRAGFLLRYLTVLLALGCGVPHLLAHNPISSWATVTLHADTLELRAELATESVWLFLGETLDRAPDVQGHLPRVKAKAGDLVAISLDGEALIPIEAGADFSADDAIAFRAVYARPKSGRLHFDAKYVVLLPADHRASFAIVGDDQRALASRIFKSTDRTLYFDLPSPAPAAPTRGDAPSEKTPGAAVEPPRPAFSFGEFFKLGVEHILTGYDHLLFLLGLLVVCRRAGAMAVIVTCFTLAHSVTLALAGLDIVSLPSRVVEPLIAASILFVGVENLVRKQEPPRRWLLTFGFGLVHGFGFAGVLREVGLGADGAPIFVPLLAFNSGVEAGQLLVVAIALPLLWLLRRRAGLARIAEPAMSTVVLLLGGWWLLQRIPA